MSKLIMPARLCVTIDSREQRPWSFSDSVETAVAKLDSGDYSVRGFEKRWAIERKSLADYIGSITTHRERFFRELDRLRKYEQACIIVEGSYDDVARKRYRSEIHPNSVFGTTWAICARYMPVYFCGEREYAEAMAEGLMYRWLRDEATMQAIKADGQKAANEGNE